MRSARGYSSAIDSGRIDINQIATIIFEVNNSEILLQVNKVNEKAIYILCHLNLWYGAKRSTFKWKLVAIGNGYLSNLLRRNTQCQEGIYFPLSGRVHVRVGMLSTQIVCLVTATF